MRKGISIKRSLEAMTPHKRGAVVRLMWLRECRVDIAPCLYQAMSKAKEVSCTKCRITKVEIRELRPAKRGKKGSK